MSTIAAGAATVKVMVDTAHVYGAHLAYEIRHADTGRDIAFKYHNVGVGGRPFVTLGQHQIPVLEFLGLVTHHLRRSFRPGDIRGMRVDALEHAEIVPRSDGTRIIDFSKVRQAMSNNAGTSPREDAAGCQSEPDFKFEDVAVSPAEFIEALEYFFSNHPYDDPTDIRLEFFVAMAPNWSRHARL